MPIKGHHPLETFIDSPVNLQLVGSDGSGTHAVATLGGLIFDAAEARALPLSRAALDRCVGAQLLACGACGAPAAGQKRAQAIAARRECSVSACAVRVPRMPFF